MSVRWSEKVNTRAFSVQPNPGSNFTEVKFESGKVRRFLNSNRVYKKFSFKLKMKDSPKDLNSEYKLFMRWYEDICYSGALSFYFPNLENTGGEKEYFFTSVPSPSGQADKTVSFEVVEA